MKIKVRALLFIIIMVFNGKAISQVGIGTITNGVSTFSPRNSASIVGDSTSDGCAVIAPRGVCRSSSLTTTTAFFTKMTETFPHAMCAFSFATKYCVLPDTTNALGTAYGGGTIGNIHQSTSQSYIAGENHGWIATLKDLTETPQIRNNSLNALTAVAYGELGAWLANQNKLKNKQL
jgi:hypothetical protein